MILASFDTCKKLPVSESMKIEEKAMSILKFPAREIKKHVNEYVKQFQN